jgi:hypothetical protein
MIAFFRRLEDSLRSIAESLRKLAQQGEGKIVIDASDMSYRDIKTLIKAIRHGRLRFEMTGQPKICDRKTESCWKSLVKEIENLK